MILAPDASDALIYEAPDGHGVSALRALRDLGLDAISRRRREMGGLE